MKALSIIACAVLVLISGASSAAQATKHSHFLSITNNADQYIHLTVNAERAYTIDVKGHTAWGMSFQTAQDSVKITYTRCLDDQSFETPVEPETKTLDLTINRDCSYSIKQRR